MGNIKAIDATAPQAAAALKKAMKKDGLSVVKASGCGADIFKDNGNISKKALSVGLYERFAPHSENSPIFTVEYLNSLGLSSDTKMKTLAKILVRRYNQSHYCDSDFDFTQIFSSKEERDSYMDTLRLYVTDLKRTSDNDLKDAAKKMLKSPKLLLNKIV